MEKPVILCVDDEKIILDSIEEQLLNNLGKEFDLELAESANEGLEIIDELQQENRPLAVVVSDQIMPGIKGDQFLADVHKEYPETHTILLTGQASLEAVQKAINEAKLYRYISKPWEPNDLILTVSEAARSFVQRRQLDMFSQSNKLLRNLNQSTQELSSEMDKDKLFRKFIDNAVESVGADHGYLLLSNNDELTIEAFSAQNPENLKQLRELYQSHPNYLRNKLKEKVDGLSKQFQNQSNLNTPSVSSGNGQHQPYLFTPIQFNGYTRGYLLLENDKSNKAFEDIQQEILQMLLSQFYISLDKARLYANLEAKTEELQYEKEKVEEINNLLEEKNKDIIDSINYARRIQESILPPSHIFKEVFPESFVFYKPKDIVSGDFYWWAQRENVLMIAAVDCTGHGVPGAFMSVIASNLLNEVARNYELTRADEILSYLHNRMVNVLKQDEAQRSRTSTLDGMDLAFCYYNIDTEELQFAGAYRPLILIRDGELYEYEATRGSIAGGDTSEKKPEFFQSTIQLQPGDTFYIFSDGLPDQFGGENGRKFSKKKVKRTLTEISGEQMAQQHYKLTKTFLNWKGEREQIDDVLLIGVCHQKG